MAIFQQNPIRIAGALTPATPIDSLTGKEPVLWRAKPMAVAFAAFDPSGVSIDLSNLDYLTLTNYAAPDSVVPLFPPVVVVAADITPTCTINAWQNGLQQQAVFQLSAADTDVSLGGDTTAQIYQTVVGTVAETGDQIVYSAGYVTYRVPGNSVPLPPYGYVSDHAQTNSSGNSTINPTSLNHTEWLTVEGSARTSNVILGVVGITGGSICRVYLTLTATPDIVLNFKNGTVGGTQLSTITTGSVLNGLFVYVFNSDSGEWQPISYQLPAI